jgi:hypothetical protein
MTTDTAVLDAPDCHVPRAASDHGRLEALEHAIEHAAHYLPAQGPITIFIHHNTLHAFEDCTFDEGVQRGAKLFGCEPYLPESRYREYLHRGRILPADIDAVLLDDLGDAADVLLGFMGTRFAFRRGMIHYPLQSAPAAELEWFIAETDALTRFRLDAPEDIRRRFIEETRHWILRDHRNGGHNRRRAPGGRLTLHDVLVELIDHFGRSSLDRWSDATWEQYALQALWQICERGVASVELPVAGEPRWVRLRDPLLSATGQDVDQLVDEELIRFCSAFLDQGLSRWPLPAKDRGLWAAFSALYGERGTLRPAWLSDVSTELLRQAGLSPLASIDESLHVLGVAEEDRQKYIIETLLTLRGFAGMIQHLETRGDRVAHPVPAGSLTEYLAVRLVLERLALAHVSRAALGYTGRLDQLAQAMPPVAEPPAAGIDQRAFQVFQLAQVLGWLPPALAQLAPHEWATLVREIDAFPSIQRRRILHAAYERRYRHQTLDAVALHARRPAQRVALPMFQVVCCIDEREESFRRHLEELQPKSETFGAAGFFGVAIYYRGAADAHFVPLCPVVIRPQHWVVERVPSHLADDHRRRAETRRTLGAASHSVHLGSRSALGGAVVTGGLGVLASIPLVARVLFPRLTARLLRALAGRLVNPPPETVLEIERTDPAPGPEPGHVGYTVEEMAAIVERLLRDIGLTSGFARLVFILGHGSVSLNNPHESAHDCGACGGGRGGPNARAWARMANDARIRAALAAKGLSIPADTFFVGGYHNTCDESIEYFDLDSVPATHANDLAAAQRDLDEARRRNAHERCRRFESAPLSLTPEAALRHVEERAEDLAQVRPEYGHATNALCFVARRSRTRGLYTDRRAFLTSYDPTQDDAQHTILTRLLSAVVPVCGGISLEYYFSYVDNVGYGCGTKLPHNITSLLGVMDGAGSDLRTGLPWQMVEIHEPVRLLMVVETTPAALTEVMDRNPGIGKLCRNGWVQVATLDPHSPAIHVLRGDRFVPYKPETRNLPQAASSLDWYRGWRDHLGFAQINATGTSP